MNIMNIFSYFEPTKQEAVDSSSLNDVTNKRGKGSGQPRYLHLTLNKLLKEPQNKRDVLLFKQRHP